MFCFNVCIFLLCSMSFVASFSWKPCGSKTDPVKVISLDVYYSDQPKTLYVTGTGKSALNITAPVQGKIFMQKKFFWGWTTIPCVSQVGSCTYDDVCSLSPYSSACPSEFVTNNIPCKCPILEGQYAVKRLPIDINVFPHWMEQGTYRIKMELSKYGAELLCLLLNITL